MTYEELRKQILDWKTRGGHVDELIQLFATLCVEVIGEDSINPPPLGDFWAVGRNQLRGDQRTCLAQLTTKNTEEKT